MRFNRADLQASLDLWRAKPDLNDRAEAHNLDFDERISAARLNELEAVLPPANSPDELRKLLVDQAKLFSHVARPSVPAAFLASNSQAALPDLPPQPLVRLEELSWPLGLAGLRFDDLAVAHSSGGSAGRALLQKFLDDWNAERDSRPAFAAFKDEVLDEIAETDWASALRDAFGLPYRAGAPVALVEYDTDEVLKEAKRIGGTAQIFAFPVALDQEPRPQFFPTPRELPYGCPMAMAIIHSDQDLVAEVLHFRLTYRPHHIKKLGRIGSALPAADFRTMRNNHLGALRIAALRDDFGVDL